MRKEARLLGLILCIICLTGAAIAQNNNSTPSLETPAKSVDEDLFAGARTRNRAFFIANRITPGGNFVLGADYLRWRTDFKGFLQGINNRVNIFFQYNF